MFFNGVSMVGMFKYHGCFNKNWDVSRPCNLDVQRKVSPVPSC